MIPSKACPHFIGKNGQGAFKSFFPLKGICLMRVAHVWMFTVWQVASWSIDFETMIKI